MADELDIVSRMACFDTVYADGIAVCRVASLAPEMIKEIKIK